MTPIPSPVMTEERRQSFLMRYDKVARIQQRRWWCIHLRLLFAGYERFDERVQADPVYQRCGAVKSQIGAQLNSMGRIGE